VSKRAGRKRKERKNIERGAAHIRSTFNNTIVNSLGKKNFGKDEK